MTRPFKNSSSRNESEKSREPGDERKKNDYDYEHENEHEKKMGNKCGGEEAEREGEREAETVSPVAEIPIEDFIDLHFFSPGEVKIVVEEYLEQAAARGFAEVRIIHGRGIGEQRRHVQALLARNPLVLRYAGAPGDRGGWGATIAWLRIPAPQSS